jgi:hypothetical protein
LEDPASEIYPNVPAAAFVWACGPLKPSAFTNGLDSNPNSSGSPFLRGLTGRFRSTLVQRDPGQEMKLLRPARWGANLHPTSGYQAGISVKGVDFGGGALEVFGNQRVKGLKIFV